MKLYCILFLINTITSYNIPFITNDKIKVIVHLEQFNKKYNLLHVGISFNNNNKNVRYDFRPFNDGNDYTTDKATERDFDRMFPNIRLDASNEFKKTYEQYRDTIIFDTDNMLTKNILWGVTNKTFDEITEYEKTLHKKYKIGIYDCRHYVSQFTDWCLNDPTPVWNLHRVWDTY